MISHTHRFIFVHTAKVAGCSIEAVFGIGRDFVNWEQPDDERHMILSEYRRRFPGAFNEYFKFSFVRNHWDRLVSRWANRRALQLQKLANIEEATEAAKVIEDTEARSRALAKLERKMARASKSLNLAPFPEWLVQAKILNQLYERENGDMAPHFDFIGRYERLHQDFQTVCDRIGIEGSLPHVNGSRHEHYTEYYDDKSRAFVAERCLRDIERFGYRFGD